MTLSTLLKTLLILIFCIPLYASEGPIQIYEQEETTLYLKRSSGKLIPGVEALLQKATFSKDNSFAIGDYALVKKDFLAAHNLKIPAGAKIVQIVEKKGNEITFKMITKRDLDGTTRAYIEISITDSDLLGKVPQEMIPEEFKR